MNPIAWLRFESRVAVLREGYCAHCLVFACPESVVIDPSVFSSLKGNHAPDDVCFNAGLRDWNIDLPMILSDTSFSKI